MNVTIIILIRCPIFHLKCIKFNFGWGSAPDPAGEAHSASLNAIARLGEGKRKGRRGRKQEREGGVRMIPDL